MFRVILATIVSFMFFLPQANSQSIELKSRMDSVAYSIGFQLGNSLMNDNIDVNPRILAAGIEGAKGGNSMLTEEQVQMVMQALSQELQGKQQEEMQKAADEALAKGKKFLEENKNKPGVKVTASGLQYEVVTEGTGKSPKAENTVKVHYEGKTIDGEIFDSSIQRGEPVSFPLNRVIKGWTEGVQLMKVGAKYKFYIPSDLAYGPNGAQGAIGPNETLIFEVELLEIEETPAE